MTKLNLHSMLVIFSLFASLFFRSANATIPTRPLCPAVLLDRDSALSESPAFPRDERSETRRHREIKNSKDLSDFLMREMREVSDDMKNRYEGKVLEVDVLCRGAGPQCAAASLVLGQTPMRAVVIERSKFVARTFAEKDFFINSVERTDLTMHNFPGGWGSLALQSSGKYAHSSQLAAHIQAQQYISGVPVLLGTEALETKIIVVNGEKRYLTTTSEGLTISSKYVFTATGLGGVASKVPDSAYQAEFERNYQQFLHAETRIFPIMTTDTILVAIKRLQTAHKDAHLPKDIIIIGDGDGARIALEGLSKLHLPQGATITIVGNDIQTASEYVASRNGGDRYIPDIVPLYEAGLMKGVPAYVQAWEGLANERSRLTLKNKKTGALSTVEGSLVIDSTGYASDVPQILAGIGAQEKMKDVKGPLPELNLESTVLARQAVDATGQALNVFAFGAGAQGPLATAEELADAPNKNPMAIFNTVPRTSMAVSQIFGLPAFASVRGKRSARPKTLTGTQLVEQVRIARHAIEAKHPKDPL